MIRRARLPKAIGSRVLHLIFFKFPTRPMLSLGTFVGNVCIGLTECYSLDPSESVLKYSTAKNTARNAVVT